MSQTEKGFLSIPFSIFLHNERLITFERMLKYMGILNKEVELKWNPSIIKYYTEKGYSYTKVGKTFIVKIEDLLPNSNILIDAQCDYCLRITNKQYGNVLNSINNSYSHKYACHKCQSKKMHDENKIKLQINLLTRDDKGYWQFKENRLKELDSFIKNNENSIDFLPIKDKTLYCAIYQYDGSINALVEELGYLYNDIASISLNNYYKDFNNVQPKLQQFINENGRFPTKEEIINNLKIRQPSIDYHGGMFELKRKMNYFDENDLVDDNGFINRSSLEYIVAQYLIKNHIPYKREQHPFPKHEGQYRSDFLINTVNDGSFHVEVWGYSENHNGEIPIEYQKNKKCKLELYSKYNINLISIECNFMTKNSLSSIQKYLEEKFSTIKEYKFKNVPKEYLILPCSLSDEEILNIIMKYSDNDDFLPTQITLRENGKNRYSCEIRKRYDDYLNFAKKFNKQLRNKKFIWNEETIFDNLLSLVKDGKPINKETLKDKGFMGLTNKVDTKGSHSLIPIRLNFYYQYVNDGGTYIHHKDILFLNNVTKNIGANVKNKVTADEQEKARMILKIYELNTLPFNNALSI